MLYLLLNAGADTYALATTGVVAVVPLTALKAAPGAGAAVLGILNFHGQPVPVVDCGVLLANRPSALQYSTRIILHRVELGGCERLLGLVGEDVTRVKAFADSEFVEPGARAAEFPCVGRVAAYDGRWIQRLHPDSILTAEIWETLITQDA